MKYTPWLGLPGTLEGRVSVRNLLQDEGPKKSARRHYMYL